MTIVLWNRLPADLVVLGDLDLEKLNDPTVVSAFQAAIGGRFAPLATLVDENGKMLIWTPWSPTSKRE